MQCLKWTFVDLKHFGTFDAYVLLALNYGMPSTITYLHI